MFLTTARVGLVTLAAALVAAPASAGLGDYTETFDVDSANWYDAFSAAPVGWSDLGGVTGDGDGYAMTSFAFADAGPFGVSAFRAQDEFNSSGNAFVGDWIAEGVQAITFSFRHSAPVPVSIFARIAGPANFPGAAAVSFEPVLPDTWTEVTIPVVEGGPNIQFEGASYGDVFGDVGHLQIGFTVPDGFGGDVTEYAFALDNVGLTVPGPAGLALLVIAGAVTRRRRR